MQSIVNGKGRMALTFLNVMPFKIIPLKQTGRLTQKKPLNERLFHIDVGLLFDFTSQRTN
ncbi:hypothetical protein D1814_00160 [Alteromonas sp. BL110]|nr:hypothetical protein D1814_00160 [Alteromonas sp. BL110]RKM79952.1 hypothetical protein D7031_13510 [Alteromonas sp. BL110]